MRKIRGIKALKLKYCPAKQRVAATVYQGGLGRFPSKLVQNISTALAPPRWIGFVAHQDIKIIRRVLRQHLPASAFILVVSIRGYNARGAIIPFQRRHGIRGVGAREVL